MRAALALVGLVVVSSCARVSSLEDYLGAYDAQWTLDAPGEVASAVPSSSTSPVGSAGKARIRIARSPTLGNAIRFTDYGRMLFNAVAEDEVLTIRPESLVLGQHAGCPVELSIQAGTVSLVESELIVSVLGSANLGSSAFPCASGNRVLGPFRMSYVGAKVAE